MEPCSASPSSVGVVQMWEGKVKRMDVDNESLQFILASLASIKQQQVGKEELNDSIAAAVNSCMSEYDKRLQSVETISQRSTAGSLILTLSAALLLLPHLLVLGMVPGLPLTQPSPSAPRPGRGAVSMSKPFQQLPAEGPPSPRKPTTACSYSWGSRKNLEALCRQVAR